MTSGEELWGHFYSADKDRDLALDTREWVDYLRNNDTDMGKKSHKMRYLGIYIVGIRVANRNGKINKNNQIIGIK